MSINIDPMKIGGKISDVIGITSGTMLANPDGDLLSGVTTLLNASPVISQGAADDIAKMLAGLVVTILSRWIFSIIERKKEKKAEKAAAASVVVEKQPENITLSDTQKQEK